MNIFAKCFMLYGYSTATLPSVILTDGSLIFKIHVFHRCTNLIRQKKAHATRF